MMVPLNSGERVLRALEQRMPWLRDERIPSIAQDSFQLALSHDGEIVALVRDEANDRLREVPVSDEIREASLPEMGKLLADQGPTILLHARVLLAAPWC